MFCPDCKDEFRPGIQVCPDCEVALVAALPEEEHDQRPFVAVFETGDPALLPVAQSLLDDAGIPCSVSGEETLGLFPTHGLGVTVGGRGLAARVMVSEDQAEAAKALLADLREYEDEEEDEDAGEPDDEDLPA